MAPSSSTPPSPPSPLGSTTLPQRLFLGYLAGLCAVFLLSAPLSFVHRELGAVRNWQLALNLLLLVACLRWGPAQLSEWRLPRWSVRLYFGATLAWVLAVQLCRYGAFNINGIDFSIFDWMLYNTNHRRFMYSPIYDVNHFGVHPSYILFVLLPFHRIFESPLFLIVVCGLGLWGAQLPLWRLTKRLVGDGAWPPLVCLALLTSAWFGPLMDGGFRPEALYPLFGLAWILGWVERRPSVWIPALLGFLSLKEDAAFYVVATGVGVMLFESRRWRPALAMVLGGLGLLAVNVGYVQPSMLAGSGHIRPGYLHFWGQHGNSLPEILLSMLKQPFRVLWDILRSSWYRMFAPALFLPLLSRVALFGMAPTLFLLGTASYGMMRGYKTYYPVTLLPFFFWGLLEGARRLEHYVPSPRHRAGILLTAVLLFPLFGSGYAKFREPEWRALKVARELPKHWEGKPGPLCVQTVLFPHLPYTRELVPLSHGCLQEPGAIAVVNTRFDPYPHKRRELERLVQTGDAVRLEEGFALVRGGQL